MKGGYHKGSSGMPNIMHSAYTSLCIIVIGIMVMKTSSSAAMKICPVSRDILELKRHFGAIKDFVHDDDKITDINLLRATELNKINASERCCFLFKLGTFYVTNIFPQLDPNTNQIHRGFFHLANSMLGLKITLKHCHATMRCPCGEQAHSAIKEFKDHYYMIKTEDAILKAVGEMNILFHWIEKNFKS